MDHALSADIKSTTHPIVVNVNHTIDAVNAFDDICYEKGASFIKVLSNYIGRDALKKGTREYFAKYKFQETEMKDFIECL
jgi:aminopeptidase N